MLKSKKMNKRNYVHLTLMAVAFLFIHISCSDDKNDDFPAPLISNLEIGYHNSQEGYRGSDLHIDADIMAEGRIDRIVIEIHPESDHHHDHKAGHAAYHDEVEWEFTHTWTEFSGLKNTNFHKHIDIPLAASPGDYHFHFMVIDMDGKVTTADADLKIKNPENTPAPEITITSAPADGEVFHLGEEITISGSVSHELGLGGMYIGLVRANQQLDDADVNASNTITLLHTHDFDSPHNHTFQASITVGAEYDNNITPKPIENDIAWQEGEYYILVKSRDAFGGPFGYSQRYPVEIHMH